MRDISFPARLRQRFSQMATGGAASIAAGAMATNVLRIVSSMTLSRLLDSRAFGVTGIITSVAVIFALVSDIGVMPFVIRHARGDDQQFLDEIWTLRLIRSVLLGLVMVLLSRPIAAFLGKPEFALVLAIWSLNFLFDGLSSMSFATSVRNKKLWLLTMSDIYVSLFQIIVAILFAIYLHSYWALIISMLFSSALKALLSYALFPGSRRRFSFSWQRSREMWNFSRFIAPSSLLSLLILQTDKVVLARLMPLSIYGLYAIAATLAAVGPGLASSYARRVLYPAYAEIARTMPDQLLSTFYGRRRWANLLYMAASGALCGGADLIVQIMYDSRYQDVGFYLRLLSISAALSMQNNASEEVLIVVGKLRATLQANIVRIVWLIAAVLVVVATGRIVILVAAFGSVELVAMASYWSNLRIARLFNFREELSGLAVACAAAILACALSAVALPLLHHGACVAQGRQVAQAVAPCKSSSSARRLPGW
jgi:O-antigen/teichoic acid export membrane protein